MFIACAWVQYRQWITFHSSQMMLPKVLKSPEVVHVCFLYLYDVCIAVYLPDRYFRFVRSYVTIQLCLWDSENGSQDIFFGKVTCCESGLA